MKKLIFTFFITSVFLVACNKANNNNSVAAPPPAPTTQCIQAGIGNGYNNNTGYYPGTYPNYNNGYPNSYNPNLTTANGSCDPTLYNQYSPYGFSAYPYTSFNSYNWSSGYNYMPLCDCPINTRPVYNGSIGLGCVSIQQFEPIATGAYFWSLSPNNYQWVNWTQVSNTNGAIGSMSNCYQQVASACFIDTPNSCGTGYTCQATSGGSRLGICRQQ